MIILKYRVNNKGKEGQKEGEAKPIKACLQPKANYIDEDKWKLLLKSKFTVSMLENSYLTLINAIGKRSHWKNIQTLT